jgi:prepilin-type N-terminal cleavage/methylation domain-containing protein/prepilin-type processing-associated H-X9-DG protein
MKPLRTSRRANSGFTLIELLVVITVIGILIALLLPAVQQARVAARNTECKNNMRQIGLSMHNYLDAHGVLPPGMFNYLGADIADVFQADGTKGLLGSARSCWMQRLLPYLDQRPLYDKLPFDSSVKAHLWGVELGVPIWTVIPQFMCPLDPANPKNVTDGKSGPETSEGFHGNIVMCSGSTEFGLSDQWQIDGTFTGDKLNGMFYALSSTRSADVTDGLSNTVMGSELIITHDGPTKSQRDNRGRYYNCYRGGALFSTKYPPNTSIPDEFDFCMPNPAAPCNQSGPSPDVKVLYARSYHSGGVNAMLGDGSVRFVSENISTEVFRALGTRAGGETVGEF